MSLPLCPTRDCVLTSLRFSRRVFRYWLKEEKCAVMPTDDLCRMCLSIWNGFGGRLVCATFLAGRCRTASPGENTTINNNSQPSIVSRRCDQSCASRIVEKVREHERTELFTPLVCPSEEKVHQLKTITVPLSRRGRLSQTAAIQRPAGKMSLMQKSRAEAISSSLRYG